MYCNQPKRWFYTLKKRFTTNHPIQNLVASSLWLLPSRRSTRRGRSTRDFAIRDVIFVSLCVHLVLLSIADGCHNLIGDAASKTISKTQNE